MIIFVGQAPNSSGVTNLEGGSVHEMFGLTREEFLSCKRVNLLSEFPGKVGKGDAFPLTPAVVNQARLIATKAKDGDVIVALGQGVMRAFCRSVGLIPSYKWFEEVECCRATLVSIPHPSGINRWWNVEDNRKQAKDYVRRLYALRGNIG